MLQLLLSERSAVTIQVVAGRKFAVPGAGTPVRTDPRPGHPPGGPTPAEGHARSISRHAGRWIPAIKNGALVPKRMGRVTRWNTASLVPLYWPSVTPAPRATQTAVHAQHI